MNLWKVVILLTLFAALSSGTGRLYAQSTATQATGTVLTPLTVNSSGLSFGYVFPGVTKEITYTNSKAAKFTIQGEPGKQITADLTLPASLMHTGGSIQTLSISFSEGGGGFATTDDPFQATTYDPGTTLTATLDHAEGILYIWLGGQVDPILIQDKGDYSGDITLDIAYTGN